MFAYFDFVVDKGRLYLQDFCKINTIIESLKESTFVVVIDIKFNNTFSLITG